MTRTLANGRYDKNYKEIKRYYKTSFPIQAMKGFAHKINITKNSMKECISVCGLFTFR